MDIYALYSCIEDLERKRRSHEDAKKEIRKLLDLFANFSWLSISPPDVSLVFVEISRLHDLLHTCNSGWETGQVYGLRSHIKSLLRHIAANYVREPVSSSFLKNQGLRIDEYVDLLLREVFKLRKDEAVNFYKIHLPADEQNRIKDISGIDFRYPVRRKSTAQYDRLYQWLRWLVGQDGARPLVGCYWSPSPHAQPANMGISQFTTLKQNLSGGQQKELGHIERTHVYLPGTVIAPTEVLESTASEINDTFSVDGGEFYVKGGGIQVFLPLSQDKRESLWVSNKLVDIE